jgi:general secretion pathway protein F
VGAFEFSALDTAGRLQKGVLEADTPRQIRQQLRERGLSPLSVIEVQQREARRQRSSLFRRGISATDLALISRQFATLVHAGLPIEQALQAVSQQSERPRIKSMIMGVRSRLLEGHSLAAALGDFPHVFSDLYRATVSAGEQSGHLDLVLERLADYTETRQQLRSKIMVALIYPIFVSCVALLVVTLLLGYVVPKVIQVFQNIGHELPLLTRMLIAVSDFVNDHGILLGAGLLAAIVFSVVVFRRPGPKRRLHQVLLRLPLTSRIVRGMNTARFARTFSILTASGVPVLDGLRISANVITNLPMQSAVEEASRQVREGGTIHLALAKSGYFSPMTLQLIASGEASGNLEGMLERAAIGQEREMETLISALLGLLEPVMILIMGGMVLVIVLAILLPIFGLNNLVGM